MPTIVAMISTLVFVLAAYRFAIDARMEITGLAYAYILHTMTQVLLITIYVYGFLPRKIEIDLWPTNEIFQELSEFFSLAIPSVVIFALVWLCLEVYVILSGTMGAVE